MMHNTLACLGLASNDNSERNGILFAVMLTKFIWFTDHIPTDELLHHYPLQLLIWGCE